MEKSGVEGDRGVGMSPGKSGGCVSLRRMIKVLLQQYQRIFYI